MYNKLMAVIDESGIWSGSQRETHAFRLSPDVFKITTEQKKELEVLGFALYDCLLGLSHIATIAYQEMAKRAWLTARRVFSTGVPDAYIGFQAKNAKHIPRLLKVDFMLDAAGDFRIAEIDGHNKHGVGYSTLAMRFRDALVPTARTLPGAAKSLASEVQRLGYQKLKILCAERERFYLPELHIVKQELEKHGVACEVIAESQADAGILDNGLFLDLPLFYERPELYSTISPAYESGAVGFIIPPKPFLGAKGLLALLRNDVANEHLECILRSFIRQKSLELVRRYIPETILVGKQAADTALVLERTRTKKYVLKESISSGMKGTVFSDDADFGTTLERAYRSRMNWILQEEVENQPQTFSWYENGNGAPELKTTDDWYMRVTVQYVNRGLADVVVTARRSKAVHGGKDCLQLGTIVL